MSLAAVPLVALAAWQALADVARIKPGQKVLVHAGAGGLGSTVIQLARHLGAYVATTARGNDAEKMRGLGASEVIDYTKADFAELLSGYDVVLDSLGGDNLTKSLTVLKPGGLAISVVGPPDAAFAEQVGRTLLMPVMALMSRKVRVRARKLGVRYSFFFMRADGGQLKALAALYDAGTLRPVLDRTFPFDDTLDAMAYVEQGRAKGKIVVTMPPSGHDDYRPWITSHVAAARPATVPDDQLHWKLNAGSGARLWVAIGHYLLRSDNFRLATSTVGDR